MEHRHNHERVRHHHDDKLGPVRGHDKLTMKTIYQVLSLVSARAVLADCTDLAVASIVAIAAIDQAHSMRNNNISSQYCKQANVSCTISNPKIPNPIHFRAI